MSRTCTITFEGKKYVRNKINSLVPNWPLAEISYELSFELERALDVESDQHYLRADISEDLERILGTERTGWYGP